MDTPAFLVIIEDHEPDFILYSHVIQDAGHPIQLHWINNGQAAMEYFQEAVAKKQPLPNLVLLDLNLPRFSGHELLRFFKKETALRHIPIIILSSSGLQEEKAQVMAEGASEFIQKPLELDKLTESLNRVITEWLLLE